MKFSYEIVKGITKMGKRKLKCRQAISLLIMTAVSTISIGCGAQTNEQSEVQVQENAAENSVNVEIVEQQKEQTSKEKWGIEEFTYVMIPGEDDEKAVQLRNDMCQDLSDAIGLPVKVYQASDYNAAVEALRTGSAQMALLGPFSYVTAVDRADAECICVAGTNGEIGYQSYIITQADSDINALEDLEGRSFGFVDPSSTSGNVVPCNDLLTKLNLNYSFDEIHIDGNFFSAVTYTGNHQNSLQAVVQGNVDAAAVSSTTYANQIEKGNVEEKSIKIIHESAVIPGSPVCVREDLPEELKQIVEEFLLAYDDEEYFGGANKRYIAVEDSDYDVIRELQQKFGLTD